MHVEFYVCRKGWFVRNTFFNRQCSYFHLWAISKEDIMCRVCFQNEIHITGKRSIQRFAPMLKQRGLSFDFDFC